jgi:hypothetical protein
MLLPAALHLPGNAATLSPFDSKSAISSLLQNPGSTMPLLFIAACIPASPLPPNVARCTGTPSKESDEMNFGDADASATTSLSDALQKSPMCGLPKFAAFESCI